jgi:hypothetical protein
MVLWKEDKQGESVTVVISDHSVCPSWQSQGSHLNAESCGRPAEIGDVAKDGLLLFLGLSSLSAPYPDLTHLSRTNAIQIFFEGVSINGAS